MLEADLSTTRTAMEGNQSRNNGDQNLLVRFFMQPKQSSAKSLEAGRPIYVDREYIQIIQPGNKDSIIIRPASYLDINRFPEHYKKWKSRQDDEEHLEGTLLEHWPAITRAQVEELRYFHIKTVEQLAAMSDSNAQGLLGINVLRERAAEYLEASKTQASADEVRALKAQNAQMFEELKKLQSAVDVINEDKPARRRRAGKSDETEDEG